VRGSCVGLISAGLTVHICLEESKKKRECIEGTSDKGVCGSER